MLSGLETFLRTHEVVARESAKWIEVQIEISVSLLLTSDIPTDSLLTSARCVIVAMDQVLVMTNPGGQHILPGGRRELHESVTAALKREVREETGIEINRAERIAVLHFHHETPKPADHPYPYPDFLNQIFLVHLDHVPQVTVQDDYELAGRFIPFDSIEQENIPPIHRFLVNHLRKQLQRYHQ